MELNKNKIIFLGVGAMILLSFVFLLSTMNKKEDKTVSSNNTFKIWILGGSSSDTYNIIEGFKQLNSKYKSENIIIESFSSYEDYTYTLMSALNSGNGPDLFVLNNNEKQSIFSNQTIGIDQNLVNPSDFRKKYKGFFGDDLIESVEVDGKEIEFLKGVPVGYETLGVFYNRRYVRSADLETLSSLNNIVSKLKNKNPDLIPIGIGNGTTVDNSADIITQFFMLEKGVSGLSDLMGNVLKQGLASYLLYGDVEGYNKFNSRYAELRNLGEDSLYLFSRGETFMVVGYPSIINKIKENGFAKSYLQASPFPHYYSGEGKTLVNYNYFVINKDTLKMDLAQDFLTYLSTDNGAENYLKSFPYYLPALLSLESDKLKEKIHPDFNVTLKDFYNSEYELSSFDKGIRNIYDKEIMPLLDNSLSYENNFSDFIESVICKTDKVINFKNLSKVCE